jgi:hypothetical protein
MMPGHQITRLNLLSREECGAVRSSVMALRDNWLQRDPQLPFFTLGAASYLDAKTDREDYRAKAREFNPLLSRHFGWLYEKLAAQLASHFAAPVSYAAALALPGYHVYLAHPVFEKPIASIHCDTQYSLHDWSGAGRADFTRPMSFTLSIALPQCGGGLNTWDELQYEELAGLTPQALARRLEGSAPRYIDYEVGQLVLHSGHVVHQAAPAARIVEGDKRITLQGHALSCDGEWVLYW